MSRAATLARMLAEITWRERDMAELRKDLRYAQPQTHADEAALAGLEESIAAHADRIDEMQQVVGALRDARTIDDACAALDRWHNLVPVANPTPAPLDGATGLEARAPKAGRKPKLPGLELAVARWYIDARDHMEQERDQNGQAANKTAVDTDAREATGKHFGAGIETIRKTLVDLLGEGYQSRTVDDLRVILHRLEVAGMGADARQ